MLKSLALLVVIGGPMTLGALWLMSDGGRFWFVWLWIGWLAVILFFAWAYPAWIAPLFWKFRRLADEGLEERLRRFLEELQEQFGV